MKKGVKQLVAEANAEIRSLTAAEAIELARDEKVLLVDLRDIRERQREGFVPNSYHAPRGMLEFWIDPDSPYYRDVFGSGSHFVFFCAGGLRSALSTKVVQDMGLAPVSHIESGFAGWVKAGGPVLKTGDGRQARDD